MHQLNIGFLLVTGSKEGVGNDLVHNSVVNEWELFAPRWNSHVHIHLKVVASDLFFRVQAYIGMKLDSMYRNGEHLLRISTQYTNNKRQDYLNLTSAEYGSTDTSYLFGSR